jgi:hypothetical protein
MELLEKSTLSETAYKNPHSHSAAGEESHFLFSSQKIKKEILRTSTLE